MAQKAVTRELFSKELEKNKGMLQKDVFFIAGIRATKDNSLQVEVCQNRLLGGRKRLALVALNQSDDRFGSNSTLLFDWMKATPSDIVRAFPELKLTVADLEAIAKTWSEDAPTGKNALIYPVMQTINKMVVEGEKLTPMIVVTERTETQIANGEFYKEGSKNQEENIRLALEEENRVMKTGSDADADYIVDSSTGDRIFRFTRTEFKEDGAKDDLIPNKMTKAQYLKAKSKNVGNTALRPEDLIFEETANLPK